MTLLQRISNAGKNRFTLIVLAGILVALALAIVASGDQLLLGIGTFAFVSMTMALGFQIFMGNSGILSWTYIGFVGIGAFVSSIVSTPTIVKSMAVPNMYPFLVQIQFHPVIGFLAGSLVAALIAAIIAWPLMRLSDAVGVITQFAALIVINVVLTQWDNVTNGPRTFFGVPQFTTIWVALAGALIALCIAYYFRESSLGLRLRASRDNRYAAIAVGVDVVKVRYLSFILSAGIGGFAGGLWAHYITSFQPKTFYIVEMFVLLSMLVIGGAGSVTGAVMGTVVITVARQGLRQVENVLGFAGFSVFGLTEICLALFMIIILIWKPAGLSGGRELEWNTVGNLWKRKSKGETNES